MNDFHKTRASHTGRRMHNSDPDPFPKYFENRKQTNLKLLYFPTFPDCSCFFLFFFFNKKLELVLNNIHEYVNKLICIYEL